MISKYIFSLFIIAGLFTCTTGSVSGQSFNIVYVNLDSLQTNYLMAKDLSAGLEQRAKSLDAELSSKQSAFQAKLADFKIKAETGAETRATLAEMEQQLNVEQQNLLQLSEKYRKEIAALQAAMQRRVLQAIMDYLKEFNKGKGYKYILRNAFNGEILFADPSLNITAPVLEAINAKYVAERGKKIEPIVFIEQ